MPTSEAQLSAHVTVWARGRGYMVHKLVAGEGWPDKLFVLPNGRVAFIEFKSPSRSGKNIEPSKHQQYIIKQLVDNRADVLVTNDITQAKKFLLALELGPGYDEELKCQKP